MSRIFSLTLAFLACQATPPRAVSYTHLASIGLIGQVFQLQPVGLRAYLLWSVLVLPMALFSKKAVLPLVWIPVFVISGLDTLFDFAWFDKAIDFLESGLPYAGILTGLILLALSLIHI